LALCGLDVQCEDGRFWRDMLRQSEQGPRLGKQRWMTFRLAEVLKQWLRVGRLQSKAVRLKLIEAPAIRLNPITRLHSARLMGAEISFPVVVGHPSKQH